MTDTKTEQRNGKDKTLRQKLSAVGVATSATGLFVIDILVDPEKLAGWGILRWLQLTLALLATLCGIVGAIRKNLPMWHNIFNVGAVTSVVWSLVLALFLGPRELTGWDPLHIIQLTLLSTAAVSAGGIAWFEIRAARERKRLQAGVKRAGETIKKNTIQTDI